MKHLLSIHDLSRDEIDEIFALAADLKQRLKQGERHRLLDGQTFLMLFEKPSTRTRVSFETGAAQLGAHPVVLNASDTQLGRGETIHDTAKVLSRNGNGIMARTFAHDTVLQLAEHGSIPVINGLTDLLHPCQGLTDYFTIRERFSELKGLTLTYVGDGNNVCHSLLFGGAKLGVNVRVAVPPGHAPDAAVVAMAQEDAAKTGATIQVMDDPAEAAAGAQVIYTDTWTSMGQEDEAAARRKAFAAYQVNEALLRGAAPDAIVLHCLPAHRGEEITDAVMDGPRSAVFDEAENRLHVQKAIMALLMRS